MSDEAAVTRVDDIELPVRIVELSSLKTKAGEPVRVQCERMDELAIASIVRSWPGSAVVQPDGMAAVRTAEDELAEINRFAEPLIGCATVLVGPDGEEVRPAFYYGKKPLGSRAINGKLLRQQDVVHLITTILQLCGYGGAADAQFPDGVGGGRSDGVAVVEVGEGVGADPVGSGA